MKSLNDMLSDQLKDDVFRREYEAIQEEYDIKSLNPHKNPYAGKTKQQATMNMNASKKVSEDNLDNVNGGWMKIPPHRDNTVQDENGPANK